MKGIYFAFYAYNVIKFIDQNLILFQPEENIILHWFVIRCRILSALLCYAHILAFTRYLLSETIYITVLYELLNTHLKEELFVPLC